MLASARPRYAAVLEGLRGISPRSQGTLGQEGLSSAIALGGLGCRRSYARRGLIPLRCGFGWAPRDQALRSQVSSGKDELSRYARGVVRHGVGPTYLHKRGHYLLYSCLCDSSAGPGLYSQGTWGQGELSRWRARGNRVFTFRCGLRPGPAAAWGSPPLRVLKRGPGRRKRNSRGPCLGSRSDAPRPVLKLPPGIQGRSSRRRAS